MKPKVHEYQKNKYTSVSKKAFFFAIAVAMLAACSKDDDSQPIVYGEENPQAAYLAKTGFDQTVNESHIANVMEHGIRFKPTAGGVITGVTARIPVANANLRITIWDVEKATPIKILYLNASEVGAAVTQSIAALPLRAGKEYMISLNSPDIYKYQRADGLPANYPVLAGNIRITGYGYCYTREQTMPSVFPDDYYCGDLSFTFKRTNYSPPKPVEIDERPLSKFVYHLGFNSNYRYTTHFGVHWGYVFSPTVNGKIAALVVRVATVEGIGKDAIVRLWDKTTGTMLLSEDVDVPSEYESKEYEVPIHPILLTAGHEYIITGSYNYIFHHFNQDNSPGNYPSGVGSIDFLNSTYIEGDEMPTNAMTTTYNGDIGFVFQKAE